MILIISNVVGQNSRKCNYTINSWRWSFNGANVTNKGGVSNVTIHDADSQAIVNRGDTLKLKGGDVICMDAAISHKFLRFKNIIGDSINPVIITNINGQVKIKNITTSYGWKFENSKYFKILGNGDPNHKYGFKITTHKNSYLQLVRKTTDFEIAHVEIAGDTIAQANENANSSTPKNLLGFAGIMAKSQPICRDDPDGGSTDAGQFEMQNVSIHDNYIHDVYGEGLYLGYGFAQGKFVRSVTRDSVCTTINYPHFIRNLSVYNNIVERVGWDGIQVKNAHANAKIYNNTIKNYAFRKDGNHDEGLFVGDGSEAIIYGNWIENGTEQSNGIQINASGNTKIYNNVVLGAGYTGLYLNNNNYLHLNPNGVIEIYNNTLEGGFGNAITSFSNHQLVKIKNNIGFRYGKKDTLNDPYPTRDIRKSPHHITSNNITNKDATAIGFVDITNKDIRLKANSTAIDSGTNHSFDEYDFLGVQRSDRKIDIGAIEKNVSINNSKLNISITNPVSSNVTFTSNQDIDIEGFLVDTNNKVSFVEYIINNNVVSKSFMPSPIKYHVVNQEFNAGINTFNLKATLFSGATITSSPLTINNLNTLDINENKIKIHHNSFTSKLIIFKSKNINIKEIELYNILGKKIQSWKKINNNNKKIHLKIKNLFSWVYIIKAKTSNGVFTKKMIVN